MIDQALLRSKMKEITEHPLVKHFLSDPRCDRLFRHVMEHPDSEEAEFLDLEFKQFYKDIRIIKYVNSMIRIFSVDFDKRVRKNRQRFPLIVDGDSNITEPPRGDAFDDYLNGEEDLSKHLQDQSIYEAFLQLTRKQREVLTQIYLHGASMQEIADSLGESRQNISKIHKRAIEKIRNMLNSKGEGER
ncbi:sigma-70 family RNA polymerase sigma factor [Bacillus swezeyi]|uniref:RNA polymerase subunit sigma-70 n=1 Tax=Bacillus swezeyi TaxID=1925020 RepID=A0A1R1S084_9BACI|nr:sigma-70 family RNA polymerase sigma factor [Bacillus swezeyi]MEC1259589.1 sigma-70 family RNA polymerase sigma factor [Bacillus swezeyi]MED2927448.1 sigma-70 family RNA polymerase sigma factor [Bacillus swezeyi]MED2941700.1 sigma-70 family RNA polymerase sigma factor [Bacillus swezeyi]MED2962646.1 sigma-70 family RNA polymerase sigma factor [Bacillus swezeyi]MED2977248.1 sigma-70 family RNA polymerase sigma factor [Bacillus swezeyi]